MLAFGGNRTGGPLDVATPCLANSSPHGRQDFASETFVTCFHPTQDPISSEDGLTHALGTGSSGGCATAAVQQATAVRRLTPRECERLQGFPDDYTLVTYRGKPACDGPRYRALGNSMAVPVMAWIGQRIAAADYLNSET